MSKRSKGIIFLLIGCILLFTAGGWYIYNVIEDKNAGKQSAELLDKLNSVQRDEMSSDGSPVITVDGEEFCGTIIIDKLGLELPVYDRWDYTRLKIAPCRYTGSVATRDIIIAAHNYKSHFGMLNKLKVGDEVKFKDAYGITHNYLVSEITKLDGTAVTDMHSGGFDLTLFTCTKGGAQRVTVRCKEK